MMLNCRFLSAVWLGLSALISSPQSAAISGQPEALSCLLEPSQTVVIRGSVSGLVERVHVERGDAISRGQSLLSLQSALQRIALDTAAARAAFAQRKVDRSEGLKHKTLISEFERDEVLTEWKLANLAVREAERKLALRTIKSPIAGLVVKREIELGEAVDEQVLFELAALDPLYAEVVMHAEAFGRIEPGMAVSIEVGHVEGRRLSGQISIVDRVIDAASDTFGVRIEVPNPEHRVPAGLRCEVNFRGE